MSEWNAALYDNKHDFVAEYGKGLLEFVPRDKGLSVLDLGCGTGTLTAKLAESAGKVIGVDSSESMIARAEAQYPDIDFMVSDALSLPFDNQFDVVFSNAVFHWIKNHDALLDNVRRVLKPGGMLICEFGAAGNIAAIENAFRKACRDFGYGFEAKFNFPTSGRFAEMLKNHGFVIERVYDFDRPTPLKDGENGLADWIRQFYAYEIEAVPEDEIRGIIGKVGELTREALWNGSEWVADYRRLRAVAHI